MTILEDDTWVMGQVPPVLGFEIEFLGRIESIVTSLPRGTADLYIGKHPSHAKSLFPYFCVTPANEHSAKIQGFVYESRGIEFTIGEATGGEVFVSAERPERQNANLEKFFRMCQSVFTTSFTETLVYNRRGRVIRSRIALNIDGHRVTIGGQQILWWLRPGRTTKRFSYEPYYWE